MDVQDTLVDIFNHYLINVYYIVYLNFQEFILYNIVNFLVNYYQITYVSLNDLDDLYVNFNYFV